MASSVQETLQKFHKTRQLLKDMYDVSLSHFHKLHAILQDDTVRDTTKHELPPPDSTDMFLSQKDKNLLEKVINTNPVIILSGRTNCGKTSLINEFLGGTYFPTSAIPCTARIVEIFYCETNYMQIFSHDGEPVGDKIFFKKKKVPEDKINLEATSRDAEDQVKRIVKVGLNHDLLKHGIKLVDVPGLSENEELDDVVKQYLDGMLQLLVYVIDGKNMVKNQDVSFINQLKSLVSNISIIYVCNKVEDDLDAHDADKFSDEDEDDEDPDEGIAIRTFKKLKKRLLLSPTLGYHPDLVTYHGLSCKQIRNARLAKPKPLENDFTRNFQRFQKCLFDSFSNCVNSQITEAVSALYMCQRRLYDFFISDKLARLPSNRLADYIKSVRRSEEEFQRLLNEAVETKWRMMIHRILYDRLQIEEPAIMSAAEDLEFQPILLSDQASANHVIEMCRMQVRDFVLVAFIESVEVDLRNMEEWLDMEARQIRRATQGSVSESDSRVDSVLQKHLASRWNKSAELKFDVHILKNAWIAALRESVKSKLKKFKEDVEFRVKGIHLDKKWKQKTAASVFRSISLDSLTGYIIDALKEKLHADYGDLEFAMNSIMSLWGIKEREAQHQRSCVRKMIPEYTKNLCITDALACTLEHGQVTYDEQIGEGSKTKIYRCSEYKGLKNLVVKLDLTPEEKPSEGFRNIYALSNIGAEQATDIITHSAVAFDKNWKFCVIMPRYDRTIYDLLTSSTQDMPNLLNRISICYHVTRGCRNIIKREIRLNDIRPNNIFLKMADNQIQTIYNFTKCKDTKSNYPDGLPAFHFAPEVLVPSIFPKNRGHRHKSFDTYSLTVLLMQLIFGRIVRPKFSQSHESFQNLLKITGHKELVRLMYDEFLQLWDENWQEKEDQIYTQVKRLLDRYIAPLPDDRKALPHLYDDIRDLRSYVESQSMVTLSSTSSSSKDDSGREEDTESVYSTMSHCSSVSDMTVFTESQDTACQNPTAEST